jgi:hypothetical protein
LGEEKIKEETERQREAYGETVMRRLRKRKEGEESAKERKNFFGLRSQPFQGPPLPMPLVMDLSRLKTIMYCAI